MGKFTTSLRRRQLDQYLAKYKGLVNPEHGFIKEIRGALGMSSYQLADRLGVSQSAVMSMEENERQETITLRTLQRAAHALGCKLVYGLVPETTLQQQALEQAQLQAKELSSATLRTMALEQQSTSSAEKKELINELAQELLKHGKRELWKKHGK